MYQALLCVTLLTPAADPADCPCPGEKVCVKEPAVKKIPHTVNVILPSGVPHFGAWQRIQHPVLHVVYQA